MNECEKIKQEHQNLKTLKSEFDLELEKATTGAENPEQAKEALQKAKALKGELEQKRDALQEKLSTYYYLKYYPKELKRVERKENYRNFETLEGHTSWVWTLQVLPDGRIVSGSDDNTIKIWDGEKNN